MQELEILQVIIYKEFEINNKTLFEADFAKYCHEQFIYYLQTVDKYKNMSIKTTKNFIEKISKLQN